MVTSQNQCSESCVTRFSAHAEDYLAAGFTPIPVHQKLPPMKGVTGTKRSVTAEDVAGWIAAPDPWYDNIAIRHEQTVAIDVDEGYGDKDGVTQLAQLATRHKLPQLPATHSSTARGDHSPSRQYLYRVPDGVTVDVKTRLRSKPCPAVELCYRNHRYTVCAPSVHPDTGEAYLWYAPGGDGVPPEWGERCPTPRVHELATLPAEWWEFLLTTSRVDNPQADKVGVVGERELLATFRPAVHVEADVLARVRERFESLDHVGHDDFFAMGLKILEHGREGVPGATETYMQLKHLADTYLRNAGRPQSELPSMVDTIVDRVQRNLIWRKCIGIKSDGRCIFKRVPPK